MIKRSLSLAASFFLALSALLLVPATPAHAAPKVETIIVWASSSAADGRLKMVYVIHSEDHRCTLGRTFMYEYQTEPGGKWKVAAKDTSVYTPAMAIYFKPPQDLEGARVRIPAKTLADGTKCMAPSLGGKSMRSLSPESFASSTRFLADPPNGTIEEFEGVKALEDWVISGLVTSPIKACRANRNVYVEATDGPDSWVRLGRDKTPASGIFATTIGVPDLIGPLRVRALARTLPNGTKCDAFTYLPG